MTIKTFIDKDGYVIKATPMSREQYMYNLYGIDSRCEESPGWLHDGKWVSEDRAERRGWKEQK